MSDARQEFVFRNPDNADANEQTSTYGSDCQGTRDPECIQQVTKEPDGTLNSGNSFGFSQPIVHTRGATWSDNEQCTSQDNCTATPRGTHKSKLSEIGLLADQVQQPFFGEKTPYMGGGLCKGFIGQQHNVQPPGLIDQEKTGTRHVYVFGSQHPSSLQSFEDISSTKTSGSSFVEAPKSEWTGKTHDASTNILQLRDNKTNFESGADIIHSTTSIGPQIPNKTTTGLHSKSFPTPTFGETNPHLGVHQTDFQLAAHVPSIRALSLSGQQQDMKQVSVFENKTSDASVFGSNTQLLPAFCEISSTNASGYMFGTNGQMEQACKTIPQTAAFQGFRTEAPDPDDFRTKPPSYENVTTVNENPTVNQEHNNLRELNFPGLKSSRFSNQHLNKSGTPTQNEDNNTSAESGGNMMHSTTSIGPQIPNKTTTGLHSKSFSTPKFGEKNPYFGEHQSVFENQTSDARVFGNNAETLPAFGEVSSTNVSGFMFGTNRQMGQANETLPETAAFKGFRTEVPGPEEFGTNSPTYENVTTNEQNSVDNQENYNQLGNEFVKKLNFQGLKCSKFNKQEHMDVSGDPAQFTVCIICRTARLECLIDCHHLVTCMTCAEKITHCPVCKVEIRTRKRILFPV